MLSDGTGLMGWSARDAQAFKDGDILKASTCARQEACRAVCGRLGISTGATTQMWSLSLVAT